MYFCTFSKQADASLNEILFNENVNLNLYIGMAAQQAVYACIAFDILRQSQ